MANRSHDDDDEDFEDDRPQRRRGEEPRARRSKDDEEERPHRRSRSQDEDDYDDEPRRKRPRLPPERLRALAIRQKVIIVCILFYGIAVASQFFIPEQMRIILAIPVLVVALVATVFVFLLAVEVHGTGMGILFGFLTLLPCIGLIVLLIVNQQATALLQKNGVRVGLMGAKMSDIG